MITYQEDMEVKRINISPTEYYILQKIVDYNATVVPQIIFKEEGNSTVKKALRSLTVKKIITKTANLDDMRQKYLSLTEIGREVLEKHESSKQ